MRETIEDRRARLRPRETAARRFADAAQQKAFDRLVENPPTPRDRLPSGALGGDVQSAAFRAGYSGIAGVHRGVATSIQRAAWEAGAEVAKRERKPAAAKRAKADPKVAEPAPDLRLAPPGAKPARMKREGEARAKDDVATQVAGVLANLAIAEDVRRRKGAATIVALELAEPIAERVAGCALSDEGEICIPVGELRRLRAALKIARGE